MISAMLSKYCSIFDTFSQIDCEKWKNETLNMHALGVNVQCAKESCCFVPFIPSGRVEMLTTIL